jgi:transposase
MNACLYVGLDVHKKSISWCAKRGDGKVFGEGSVKANRQSLAEWVRTFNEPWIGGMEATLFTGWIYDYLKPHAEQLKVAHPLMLRAIAASKKKNDKIDASKIADCLRADLLPECYMAPAEIREMRRELRFRNLLVGEAVKMKNKISGVLMEVGAEHDKQKLHGKKYFNELLGTLDSEIAPESVKRMLKVSRGHLETFTAGQKSLVKNLKNDFRLCDRVKRLQTIRGVGEVLALTWALEVGEPERFTAVGHALSYCGLTSAQSESGGVNKRMPISKQRNKHLQTILIEAAKIAPQWNPQLKAVHEKEIGRGNRNRATLAVARKLVAYLLAVDKSGKDFEVRDVSK